MEQRSLQPSSAPLQSHPFPTPPSQSMFIVDDSNPSPTLLSFEQGVALGLKRSDDMVGMTIQDGSLEARLLQVEVNAISAAFSSLGSSSTSPPGDCFGPLGQRVVVMMVAQPEGSSAIRHLLLRTTCVVPNGSSRC